MLATILCSAIMASTPSHLGPIPSPKGEPIVAPGRVEGQAVNPITSKPSGLGKWIWTDDKPESARFLKTVDLSKTPTKSIVRITSECSFRLYVNDQIVARGPADVGRDYDIGPTGPWLYDVVDISKWIKKGPNTIAVEVIQRRLVQSEGQLGKPGLWLEADLGTQKIGSDQSWLAAPNPTIAFEKPPTGEPLTGKGEFLTLTNQRTPSEWQKDGTNWKPARLATEAERPIQQSEIPAPLEAIYPSNGTSRIEGGVNITAKPTFNANGRFSVNFDRVLSAHIVLKVKGGNGAILSIMPNERNSPGYHRAIRLKLGKGQQFFEVPFFDSFSTINIEATGVTEPIDIEEVRAVFRSYPVQYRGTFECSDPGLNKIWEVGRWSTQICMQTHHLDSPHHQEPISDPGDYLIESLISYQTFGESGLAKQDLRKYAQIIRNRNGKVFHTSYALLWLQMLVEYWQHTGDEKLLNELAPTAFQLIDNWESWLGSNGLISNPPNFMFIDWVEIEGFNLHHPPAVIGQGVLTAFYYRALQDIDKIATLQKDQERSSHCKELRKQVQNAFNRELWSPTKGLYRDGKPGESKSPVGQWLPADKQIETFSSQVNILACAYGLTSEKQARNILNRVMESGPANCQPYFMHFAFDALAETGLFNQWVTPQMRRWKVIPDTQTFPEMWDRGDLSHAWQCTPTYQLSARVLGISPLTPGYKNILIKPTICDLIWAKGSVPTPQGDVEVSWKRDNKLMTLEITIPKSATATVELPNGTKKALRSGRHNLSCHLEQ
jgi:alpha-L-rhamnosidase